MLTASQDTNEKTSAHLLLGLDRFYPKYSQQEAKQAGWNIWSQADTDLIPSAVIQLDKETSFNLSAP